MVFSKFCDLTCRQVVSVLALSSRFDGRQANLEYLYDQSVSVLALSSRFDGLGTSTCGQPFNFAFSTRSVESF